MLVQALGIVAEARAGVVTDELEAIGVDHLAEAQRSRLRAEGRPGNEGLPGDRGVDQPRDLGGRGEAVVAGLPRLDALAAGEVEPPEDAGLEREPGDPD